MRTTRLRGAPADAWLSLVAAASVGAGAVLTWSGAGGGSLPLALAGACIAATGLIILLAAQWIDGLLLVVWLLPAPALLDSAQLRLSPAAVVTALVVFSWLLGRAVDRRRLEIGTAPRNIALALLLAFAVSAALAQNTSAALRELVNITALLGLFIAATDLFVSRPERIRTTALAIATVSGLCGVLAVLESFGVMFARFPLAGSSWYRAALGFGQPNGLAMFFAIALPLGVYAAETARSGAGRTLACVAVVASVFGLITTFSRGGWLALLAATLVFALTRRRRRIARIWLLAALAYFAGNVLLDGALLARVAGTIDDPYVAQRAALTLAGIMMFRANPIVGVGPGGFDDSLETFGPQISWLWDYVGSAHNGYVEVAAETGIVGLLALLAFAGTTLLTLVRATRRAEADTSRIDDQQRLLRALLWAFATVCTVGFTGSPFTHGIGQLMVLIGAAGFALDRRASGTARAVGANVAPALTPGGS